MAYGLLFLNPTNTGRQQNSDGVSMRNFLKIASLVPLPLILYSNPVWAANESAAASAPGPEALTLFGAVIIGLISVNQNKFKK